MKLALIRRRFSSTGGAELYLQRLINALALGGHELHLFSEEWAESPGKVNIHRIRAPASRAKKPVIFAEAVARAVEKQHFDCVFSLERTLKQDVYRAGDGVHKIWLQRRRESASWWKKPFVGRGAFHRNMLGLEARTFDRGNTGHVIVNSEMVRNEIIQCFRFPPERIHLVRNGVELTRFRGVDRASARGRYGLSPDEFVLVFVGSGWERKGLKLLTNELMPSLNRERSRPARLLVAGKGSRRGLRSEHVVFAGAESEVEHAYAAADLFVFLPIYEPSANVCIEALAAGVPVITNRHNGASEVIREGITGTVLADAKNVKEAMDAVRFWERRKGDRIPMEDAELSLERNVAETMRVLELAAAERKHRSIAG